jgi:hypothetical protein
MKTPFSGMLCHPEDGGNVPPKRQFLQEPNGVNIPEDGILHSHPCENHKS